MTFDIQKMKERVLEIADPSNPYSQADFDKEFGGAMNGNIVNVSNDFRMKVNFVNKSNNPDPEYATDGASGFDLRADLGEDDIILESGEIKLIPTGLYFELPPNFEIQVRPRSGLAAKHGITVLNTPGTVDADYRGEVKVILINHGKQEFIIKHGERIAQAVVATVTAKNTINLNKIDEISNDTERGAGGFGSTGTK